jgi:alpha-galactosidase
MIFQLNKNWKRLCITLALTATVFNANRSGAATTTKPEEIQQRSNWLKDRFLGEKPQLPFSFLYAGKKSEDLLSNWEKKATSKKLDDVRTEHTLTWTDPKTGMEVRCVVVEYADLPAVDWVLHLSNTSDKDTPILEQIRPLDARIESRGKEGFAIHHSLGDSNSGRSFSPVDDVLTAEKPGPLVLAPNGGKSSDGHLPYFNVDWRTGGIAAAVGWSGQWEAGFEVKPDGSLQFCAGQQLTHLKLHPSETIRTPKILLVFWDGKGKGDSPIFADAKIGTVPDAKIGTVPDDAIRGNNLFRRVMMAYYMPDAKIGTVPDDAIRGNNLFRRVMMAHYMPRRDGVLVLPPICAAVSWADEDGNYEKPHVNAMKPYAKRGIEVLWSDMDPQQWYPKGFPEGTGTWEPDPQKYPNGLKPLGDAAKAAGIGYLLWFEPERVYFGTKIDREHPEYVMKAQGEGSQLFRLHEEKARKWLTDYIDVQITAAQINWLRWDFNIDPLGFWRRNDEPDRQGITEIRYIEGLYAMWDDLRARHPGLMIDNCAGGGRRIDIETCSRSLPLWHSDMQCSGPNPRAEQLQNGGLNRWVPMHGAGNYGLEPSYLFRSGMTAGNILIEAGSKGHLDDADPSAEAVRKTVAVYNQLRPLMAGDFYPLFPHDESASQWYGYQFDNPELKAGCAILFRREQCPDASRTIRLNGIEAASSYEVTNLDSGVTTKISGRDLLEKGLTVEIQGQPGAAVMTYKQTR